MKLIAFAASVALMSPIAATAGEFVTLSNDATLTVFDSASRKALRTINVSGVKGKLAGIDVRPADNMLYGLLEDGTVVTIDAKTGAATMKSKLETMLSKGVVATVDFNPAADRLRIIGTDGTNLRANVDDGKVTVDKKLNFAEADGNKGKNAMIVAGAYSNSYKGTKETALYDIDGALGVMARQAPPNDGVLNTMGSLGLKSKVSAFDIASDGNGGNTGWLVAGGALYQVDIASAKTTMVGPLKTKGAIRDIAVLPAM